LPYLSITPAASMEQQQWSKHMSHSSLKPAAGSGAAMLIEQAGGQWCCCPRQGCQQPDQQGQRLPAFWRRVPASLEMQAPACVPTPAALFTGCTVCMKGGPATPVGPPERRARRLILGMLRVTLPMHPRMDSAVGICSRVGQYQQQCNQEQYRQQEQQQARRHRRQLGADAGGRVALPRAGGLAGWLAGSSAAARLWKDDGNARQHHQVERALWQGCHCSLQQFISVLQAGGGRGRQTAGRGVGEGTRVASLHCIALHCIAALR
jgi:hypothetical protein